MPETILYRSDLDDAQRANPLCTPQGDWGIYLHGVCHRDAGLEVAYHHGVLLLACVVCHVLVARIAVMARPEE